MMTKYCDQYEFYSKFGQSCVHCEPFCRLYPLECSRTPECQLFITDYYESARIPAWAIALIVIFILLFFGIGLLLILKFCRCDFLCNFGCMFSFKKKRKSRDKRDEMEGAKLPYQTKSTWDPVSPTLGYDIDAIRRRTIMDRFWASIEQHPPQIGVEEWEPLTSVDDGTTQKLKGEKTSDDSASADGTNGSELNTAMSLYVQTHGHKHPQIRPSLDNRAIIENYHFDRVARHGSFKHIQDLHKTVEHRGDSSPIPNRNRLNRQESQPDIHRPVQKGRRTGLKNLLHPRVLRPGASETTV